MSDPVLGRVLIAVAVLIVVAAVLPWASAFGIDVNGTSGDGVITLVLGVLIAICGLVIAMRAGRLWAAISGCVFSALVAVTGAVDIANGVDVVSDHSGAVQIGPGLWLTLVAGIAGLIVAVVAMARRVPR